MTQKILGEGARGTRCPCPPLPNSSPSPLYGGWEGEFEREGGGPWSLPPAPLASQKISCPSPSPLLLINPWIYDFAAYDFFARPLGLLYLAGLLEAQGYAVHFLDCLGAPHARPGPFGTGRYPKEIIPPPPALEGITRRYGRYGISEAAFRERLARVPTPAAILVTSLMTYWYPGVAAAIRLARERFPDVPVILGGIYATLCPEHAQEHSGADRVVAGPGEAAILGILEEITGFARPGRIFPDLEDLDSLPYPALDLLDHPSLYSHPHLPGLPPGLHLLRLPAAPADLPAARPPGGGGRADLLAGPIGPRRRRLLRRRPAAGGVPTTSW